MLIDVYFGKENVKEIAKLVIFDEGEKMNEVLSDEECDEIFIMLEGMRRYINEGHTRSEILDKMRLADKPSHVNLLMTLANLGLDLHKLFNTGTTPLMAILDNRDVLKGEF